ncbi:cation diffusion facilitator family transporter containing protein [Aphelenchoides avenae]|nr:cation diffusion facilitator family transporter containing protein [Aphelenchus avenae]
MAIHTDKPASLEAGVTVTVNGVEDHHDHSHNHVDNLNIRAAFVHVIGDLVQSIGVLIAAIIIKFTHFQLADPICTFLFSLLVLITTCTVLRDTMHVLMEATPSHISMAKVCSDLMSIQDVAGVHSLRIWSLKMDSIAISVHLDTVPEADVNRIVAEAQTKLQHNHGIDFITVQVSGFHVRQGVAARLLESLFD